MARRLMNVTPAAACDVSELPTVFADGVIHRRSEVAS